MARPTLQTAIAEDLTDSTWPKVYAQLTSEKRLLDVFEVRKLLLENSSVAAEEKRQRAAIVLDAIYQTLPDAQCSKWPKFTASNFLQLEMASTLISVDTPRNVWLGTLDGLASEHAQAVWKSIDDFFEDHHRRIYLSQVSVFLPISECHYGPTLELAWELEKFQDVASHRLLMDPHIFFRCNHRCEHGNALSFAEIFDHSCFQRIAVDPDTLDTALEGLSEFGIAENAITTDSLPQSYTVLVGDDLPLIVKTSRWAIGEELLYALKQAKVPRPQNQEEMLALKGRFTCEDCSAGRNANGSTILAFVSLPKELHPSLTTLLTSVAWPGTSVELP